MKREAYCIIIDTHSGSNENLASCQNWKGTIRARESHIRGLQKQVDTSRGIQCSSSSRYTYIRYLVG